MRTDYIELETFKKILDAMMPRNACVLGLMLVTGMRVGDALSQRLKDWERLLSMRDCCVIYTEAKTGKTRLVQPNGEILDALCKIPRGDSPWLFPGRNPEKHLTRQAVYKDLERVCRLYRVNGKRLRHNLGTHTARKIYAVEIYRDAELTGLNDPLRVVQMDLNHADAATTYLYALADQITKRRLMRK